MEKLSKRIAMLEEMGVDTTKFNLEMTNKGIEICSDADKVVEDKQIQNGEAFRRWVMAQTFKMLYEPSYRKDYFGYHEEYGWDAYLRNNYDYGYQFKMMNDEVKVLAKLEIVDKRAFAERSMFFNGHVVIETCEDYIRKFNKYVKTHTRRTKKGEYVKLEKYGTVDLDMVDSIVISLECIIDDMKEAENYAELGALLRKFIKKMNRLPKNTSKSYMWKDAFKGNGAYYTLRNMILFHGCVLRDCNDKYSSLDALESYASSLENGNMWRLHMLLKDTIEYNDFDFRKSINK